MSRMVIDDAMWSRLEELLSSLKGRPDANDRLSIEGVCWILLIGAPWWDLPPDYGPWKTVYNRYNNWAKKVISKRFWLSKKKMEITNGTCLMALLWKFIKVLWDALMTKMFTKKEILLSASFKKLNAFEEFQPDIFRRLECTLLAWYWRVFYWQ